MKIILFTRTTCFILVMMLVFSSCIFPGKNHRSKRKYGSVGHMPPPPPPPPPPYEVTGMQYSVTGTWEKIRSVISPASKSTFFTKMMLTSDKTYVASSGDTSSKGQYIYHDKLQLLVFQPDTTPATPLQFEIKWNKSNLILIKDLDTCEYKRQ